MIDRHDCSTTSGHGGAPRSVAGPRARARAFTVIEMLVVLVIIGILAGIVITVAQRVSQGGKSSATRNVLEIADNLLTEYMSSHEAVPPTLVRTNQTQLNTSGTDDVLSPQIYAFPIVDGRYEGRSFGPVIGGGPTQRYDKDKDPAQPSGALVLLAMMSESSAVEREVKAIDARFMQRRDVFAYGWLVDPATGETTGQPVLRRLRIPVLVDAFGNLIRYVHPAFQGGYGDYFNNASPPVSTHRKRLEVVVPRQNGQAVIALFTRCYRPFPENAPNTPIGDADEGLAVGGHGYFYSSGLDADPGTREDNVYSKQPTFPPETAKLN